MYVYFGDTRGEGDRMGGFSSPSRRERGEGGMIGRTERKCTSPSKCSSIKKPLFPIAASMVNLIPPSSKIQPFP